MSCFCLQTFIFLCFRIIFCMYDSHTHTSGSCLACYHAFTLYAAMPSHPPFSPNFPPSAAGAFIHLWTSNEWVFWIMVPSFNVTDGCFDKLNSNKINILFSFFSWWNKIQLAGDDRRPNMDSVSFGKTPCKISHTAFEMSLANNLLSPQILA